MYNYAHELEGEVQKERVSRMNDFPKPKKHHSEVVKQKTVENGSSTYNLL